MNKKKFYSALIPDLHYEVAEEKWADENTYVITFTDATDISGFTYHLEAKYHKDKGNITYTRVYEHESIDAETLISKSYKKMFKGYILRQVGAINGALSTQKLNVELTLDVPYDVTIGEFQEWLNTLKVEIVHTKTPKEENGIKILEVTKKPI